MAQQRQIVLDTETTGLETADGHRVIEIGAVEIIGRKLTGQHFHEYLQPDRPVDPAAFEVHGISDEFLSDKPRFGDVVEAFLEYVDGAELVIHNAAFDIGFLDHELGLQRRSERLKQLCDVCDTLTLARSRHPGQRNTLDALCKRYGVNNSRRELHGALLDAEILADVYLAMTGGQVGLSLNQGEANGADASGASGVADGLRRVAGERPRLAVIEADNDELAAHQAQLALLGENAQTW